MNKTLAFAAIAATLFASTAFAAEDMYVTGSGDQWKLYSSTTPAEGVDILKGEAGAAPGNCPDGSFWINDTQMVLPCGGNEEFGFAIIPEGQKRASGEAYPEQSYLVQKGGKPMNEVLQ